MNVLLIGVLFVFAIILVACFHFTLFAGIVWFRVRFAKIKTLATKPKFLKGAQKNDTDNWTEEHGITFAGFIGIFGEPHAAWYFADRSLLLIKSIEGNRYTQEIELITRFPDDITLSTSNTADNAEGFPPPPGTYKQIFPRKSLDELWERHCEAERYLIEQCGVVFMPRLPDLDWPEADDIHHSRLTPDTHPFQGALG